MGLTKPKAVLFDWDNTLVNTWPIIFQALKDTFDEYKMTPWTLEQVKAKVARSMRDAFPELFGPNWEEAGQRYQTKYRKYHIAQLEPLVGVDTLLSLLEESGLPVAIVSNKKNTNLREEVTHLGWDDHFDVLVGSGDAEEDKPHPAPIFLALKQMGLEPSPDIWFIGDSHVDLEAAKNAGLTPIFYGDGEITEDDQGNKCHRGHAMHHHVLDHDALVTLIRTYI